MGPGRDARPGRNRPRWPQTLGAELVNYANLLADYPKCGKEMEKFDV